MNEESIFVEALEQPRATRQAFVEQVCAGDAPLRERIQRLLAAHENAAAEFMGEPAGNLSLTQDQQPLKRAGTKVGPYKLLQTIGEGGMGVVWVAEQSEPVKRRVALKLIKPGMDSRQVLARFEAERQALAIMDHPNIAKVFDGGMTDEGRPFFVMEYVRGVPITEYCDNARLPIQERMKLFIPVCQAVQHAHQKGIIHRDLKPSNILVCLYDGVPVPKVIDFGLAKAISQPLTEHTLYTVHGLMVGTPLYMSPEQAEFNNLDIDTRSDIYSRGVILYELLTGSTPLEKQQFKDAAFQEILRLIKEVEPPKPSTKLSSSASLPSIAAQRGVEPAQLSRVVRGDLDWIVMKSLEKERSRRYESANALGHDIERYLTDEPVEARPPSAAYRVWKYARKRRGLLTAVASVLGAIVSIGLALIAAGMGALKFEADRQAAIALKNATEADRLAGIARDKGAEADAARGKAEYEAYVALISMAAAKIDENAVVLARQALESASPELRGWEWQRLWYVVNQGSVVDLELPAQAECLALSPRGDLLATGGFDGVIRIFNSKTRQPAAEKALGGGPVKVCALAFCPTDENWLAIGTNDRARPLLLWNRQTQELQPLGGSDGHWDAVVDVTFSRDGAKLLTASHDRTAKLWDRQTRQPLATYRGHSYWVWSAAFSPDETEVATASDDGTVRLWHAATGIEWTDEDGERTPFRSHKGPVYAVAFQPQPAGVSAAGFWIASAGYDKRVLLWKPDDLKAFDFKLLLKEGEVRDTPCLELRGHAAAVRDLAFSSDGRRLLSSSSDHTLCLWYAREEDAGYAFIRAGTLDKQLRGHAASVQAAAFSPTDPQLVVSAGYDSRVKLWTTGAYHDQQALPGMALRGHVNAVTSARYAPDGRSIVTASNDRTAKKWTFDNGTPREALTFREGHSYLTSRAIFFPDGQKLLTASVDGTVRIWSRATAAELLKLSGTGYRAAVALSPDGRWVLTGRQPDGQRQGAILWNAATGERRHELLGQGPLNHKVAVGAVAFSPDGQTAFTGDDSGVGILWDFASGRPLARLNFHLASITAAAFSADGRRLLTASADKTVCPWDLTDLAQPAHNPQRLLKHPQPVNAIAIAPDNRHVVTACEDGRTRLFDMQQAGEQPAWIAAELTVPVQPAGSPAASGQSTNVSAVALSADGRWLAAVDSIQHVVRLFEMDYTQHAGREVLAEGAGRGSRPFLQLQEHDSLAWSAAFAPDGRGLVTVGGDEARLWDFQQGRELLRPAAGRAKGEEAWLWDLAVTEIGAFGPHRALTFAEFSPDGQQVITAGWDNSARLWDAASGQPLLTLDQASAGVKGGHTAAIHCARVLPGGKQVLTASEDATVRLWNIETRQVVNVYRGHKQGVTRILVSKDGRWFVSASRDGTAAVWQVEGYAPRLVLHGHQAAVLDVTLSADEMLIVTGSADRTARVWDAANGVELCRLAGHAGDVTAVAFAVDARGKLRVLTGSTDLTAKLWDVDSLATRTTGEPIASKELLTLKGHSRALTSVAFSSTDNSVLTSARDGVAIIWPANDDAQRPVQERQKLLIPEVEANERREVDRLRDRAGRNFLGFQSLGSLKANPREVYFRLVNEVTGIEDSKKHELDPETALRDVLGVFKRLPFPNGRYRLYLQEPGQRERLIVEVNIVDGRIAPPNFRETESLGAHAMPVPAGADSGACAVAECSGVGIVGVGAHLHRDRLADQQGTTSRTSRPPNFWCA